MRTLIAAAALIAASSGAALADDFSSALPLTGSSTTLASSVASAPAAPRTILDYVLAQRVQPTGVVLISTITPTDQAIDEAALRL